MSLAWRSRRAACSAWRLQATFSTSRAWLIWTRAIAVCPLPLQPLSVFNPADCRWPLGDSHAVSSRVRALRSARASPAPAPVPARPVAVANVCTALLPGTCSSTSQAKWRCQPALGEESHVALARGRGSCARDDGSVCHGPRFGAV